MKTVEWQIQEIFNFPATTGMPTGAETVKVTPRFTIDRTNASVRLTGIYHLAVNVEFEGEVSEQSTNESIIFIDDVDIQGNTGYFEYAVPFNIDLPPEADDPLNIVATNPVCEAHGQGALSIVWNVECSYKEVVIVQEETAEQKAAHAESKSETKSKSKTVNEPIPEEVVELELELDEDAPVVTEVALETVSFSEKDEVLAFLMGLDDGYSTTSFRSNDVPIQSES